MITFTFDMYLALTIRQEMMSDYLGKTLIETIFNPKDSILLQERRVSNKENFPFLTAFIKGIAFCLYYDAYEQTKTLDRNAQIDISLMMYLAHADMLVSADTKFLRHAFAALWEPQGKKLLTLDKFVAFIDG